MNTLYTVLTVVLVAGGVFAIAYFLLKEFFQNEQSKRNYSSFEEKVSISLPVKMQAYERIVLLLERMSPTNLVMRTHKQGLTAAQFHQILIQTIREEFDHNLSQQLYISDKAWEMVSNAKEEMIRQINTSAGLLDDKATSTDLSKKLLEMSIDKLATRKALDFVKNEARKVF
ncbi:MAG: hypothetical protein KGZ97_03830 [Bacteroidetes bacterium]|nr:hypothetical protein [Bacteroidota bacterium]